MIGEDFCRIYVSFFDPSRRFRGLQRCLESWAERAHFRQV